MRLFITTASPGCAPRSDAAVSRMDRWYGTQGWSPSTWPSTARRAQASSTSSTAARAATGCSPSELPAR